MLWQSGRRSSNVENRRGMSSGVKAGGAGGVFLMALVVWALGGDPTQLIMQGVRQGVMSSAPSSLTPEQEAEQVDFVSAVLGSTEDVWTAQFAAAGIAYEQPKLVLFTGYVDSACGSAQAAMGPFYCPLDRKAYMDLEFFQTLSDRLNAPGDFARAYVIAHEIGHHVQNITGTMDRVQALQSRARNRAQANALSVKLELQADCLAGVWAHGAQASYNMIEPGDIDEALNAATQIGDDALQKSAQGYAVPDSFTHGTSAQRHDAFRRGFEVGNMDACAL